MIAPSLAPIARAQEAFHKLDHIAPFFHELDAGRFDILYIGDSNTKDRHRGHAGAASEYLRGRGLRTYATTLISPTSPRLDNAETIRYQSDGLALPPAASLAGSNYLPGETTSWTSFKAFPANYGFSPAQHERQFSGRWEFMAGRKLQQGGESNGVQLSMLMAPGTTRTDIVGRYGPSILQPGDQLRAFMLWATFDPASPDATGAGDHPNDVAIAVQTSGPDLVAQPTWLDVACDDGELPVSRFANVFAGLDQLNTHDGWAYLTTGVWTGEPNTGYSLWIGRPGGTPDGYSNNLLYWHGYELVNVIDGYRIGRIARGGWTMRNLRSVVAPTDADHSDAMRMYLTPIVKQQNRPGDERLLVVIQEGINSTPLMTRAEWRADLEGVIDGVTDAWRDAGGNPDGLWFLIQTTHSFGAAPFVADFRIDADDVSDQRANVGAFHPSRIWTSQEMESTGWFHVQNGQIDRAHLSELGYARVTGAIFDRLFETPRPTCAADFDADGAINDQDFFAFVNSYFNGVDGDADVNGDGFENDSDFFDFANGFFLRPRNGPDLNNDGVLDGQDVAAFDLAFENDIDGDADYNADCAENAQDRFDFLNAFFANQ